tara:strand:+ start:147 stop:809 length:663 start_codon:yes stop_codon:yes gene_type:complete
MRQKIQTLNKKIINCTKCERLVLFREKIAAHKTKRFLHEDYWGKPVVGYGDIKASIIILGLAPAAHGGNRTGRVFTGDKSAEFLFKCLHKVGMSNQSNSDNLSDGLRLNNIYMTPVVKCVPPNDKPTAKELKNCFNYLIQEFKYLRNAKVLLALGAVAFRACLDLFGLKKSSFKFAHGRCYCFNSKFKLYGCYHPSPRNVNTGRMTEDMMIKVLKQVKTI